MKTQILGCIVGLGVLAPFSFVSCTEPLPPCLVEDASAGPYIMTYVVAGPVPTCATGIVNTGEQVGMSFYHPEIVNSDGSTTFDPNVGHVAIQGADMSAVIGPWNQVGDVDSTVGDELYAYGRFKAPLPDSNDLCYVVTDAAASVATCSSAGATCSADEDCCNGQCNIANSFACLADTDCPAGTTKCGCAETKMPGVCDDQVNGGMCQGPNVCAKNLVDDLTATQVLAAATDTGQLLMPPIGSMCAKPSDCGFCADTGATCAAATDCCSGTCTAGKCGAMPPMGMMASSPSGLTCVANACAVAPCNPANMDADCGTAGLICDAKTSMCQLGCRVPPATGNGCDATYQCTPTTADPTVGTCGLPPQTVTYQWSNVQIYTTADAQGTQVAADLAYTQTVSGQACTINYKAIGMWPGVSCAELVLTGTTKVGSAGLYGPSGMLNGTTLTLNVNNAGPVTLALSGSSTVVDGTTLPPNTDNQTDFFAAIAATWPVVPSVNAAGNLVLTDLVGASGLQVVPDTADAALGLAGAALTALPVDDLCNPCSEPNLTTNGFPTGRAVGSGINVHFPTHCDPTLLFCVLGDVSGYALNASAETAGSQQVTSFTTATTIPQVLPDGDSRIITCNGE